MQITFTSFLGVYYRRHIRNITSCVYGGPLGGPQRGFRVCVAPHAASPVAVRATDAEPLKPVLEYVYPQCVRLPDKLAERPRQC